MASAINSEVAGQKLRVILLGIKDKPLLTTEVLAPGSPLGGTSLPFFTPIVERHETRREAREGLLDAKGSLPGPGTADSIPWEIPPLDAREDHSSQRASLCKR